MKRKPYSELKLISGLILCLLLAAFLWYMSGKQKSPWMECSKESIGFWGPIRFNIKNNLEISSIEKWIRFTPALTGYWQESGKDLLFYPTIPLNSDLVYLVDIINENGFMTEFKNVEPFSCKIQVRQPQLLYRSINMEKGSIFQVNQDGRDPRLLVEFNGLVNDYKTAKDGSGLTASIKNKQNGSDIWFVSRNGQKKDLLVDCGLDVCEKPAWSADSKWIIFSRKVRNENKMDISAHLWKVNQQGGDIHPVIADISIPGENPEFSPDGKKLTFYDVKNIGIWIISEDGTTSRFIKTNSSIFAWSPDSSDLLYFSEGKELENYYMDIYLYHYDIQKAEMLLNETKNQFEFGKPVWSPDGKWILMNIRYTQGSPSKQLFLLASDGKQNKMVTDRQVENYTSYLWAPNGENIIYQKMEWGSSTIRPSIVIQNLNMGTTRELIREGSSPAWLP